MKYLTILAGDKFGVVKGRFSSAREFFREKGDPCNSTPLLERKIYALHDHHHVHLCCLLSFSFTSHPLGSHGNHSWPVLSPSQIVLYTASSCFHTLPPLLIPDPHLHMRLAEASFPVSRFFTLHRTFDDHHQENIFNSFLALVYTYYQLEYGNVHHNISSLFGELSAIKLLVG